jgi:hypothetical protein
MQRDIVVWIVTVADSNPKPWPPPWALLKLGMPNRMVQRYRRVRCDMTHGLRQRIEAAKN